MISTKTCYRLMIYPQIRLKGMLHSRLISKLFLLVYTKAASLIKLHSMAEPACEYSMD